jgi:predicted DNA-binding protein (UPF0251 family)
MARPRKRRIIPREPRATIYKPAGVPLERLTRIRLLQEEREALRLADLEGMTQAEAADQMGVSRSTFQRIVSHARRQVALALAEGHALQIEGGTFEVVRPDVRGRRRPGRRTDAPRRPTSGRPGTGGPRRHR